SNNINVDNKNKVNMNNSSSTLNISVASIKCSTFRNDTHRVLFCGPLSNNLNNNSNIKQKKSVVFSLSVKASHKLVSTFLPHWIPFRRIQSSALLLKSGSGNIKCNILAVGIIWDSILHNMFGYTMLLSQEIGKLILELH